jgi:hypothetical protein
MATLARWVGCEESRMERWFDVAAAIFAVAAAVFWFMSAYGKLPPMISYWDRAPDNDPLYVALKFSARMNGQRV